MKQFLFAFACLMLAVPALAHGDRPHLETEATYIANEGVLVAHGETKIMFDPLFTNGYGTYQTASEETRAAMFAGAAPFDGVDAIFISHAHGDHFSASDMITYMRLNPAVRIYGPKDMATMMQPLAGYDSVKARVMARALDYDGGTFDITEGAIRAAAIRVPHAGGEGRRGVQNYVWRVRFVDTSLHDAAVVMHMGDADPDDRWFAPYAEHWNAVRTDTAFPPYWFLMTEPGRAILGTRLNIDEVIGVHVPEKLPSALALSGLPFFHQLGETRALGHRD